MRLFLFASCVACLLGLSECARAYSQQPSFEINTVDSTASSTECEACVWGLRITEDLLSDPALIAKLASKIEEQACVQADHDSRDQCKQYVEMLLPVAVQYLMHSVSPEELCADATMCKQSALSTRSAHSMRRAALGGVMECSFCEYAVQALQQAMQDSKEQAQLLEEARAACKSLPASFVDVCVEYVDSKGPLIIALLETQDPKSVCTMISACDDTHASRIALPVEVAQIAHTLGSVVLSSTCPATTLTALGGLASQNCEFCKVAVMEVHDKLQEPAFQQAIVNYAKHVCANLGNNFTQQCSEMVDQYAPLVFAMLEDQLQPEKFCEEIHMCEARQAGARIGA